MLTITDQPFDPEAALAAFRQDLPSVGAVVTFTGLVRDVDESTELHLQHYPGYTEKVIQTYTDRTIRHFDVAAWRIIHRVGAMMARDPIVFVATASRHRRAAFEAADCLMDMLKSRAPFWKKEIVGDTATWIEPRDADHGDAARWNEILGDPL